MAPNNINQSNGKDLWTFSSFATLSGCVFAAYVFKSILVRFLRTPQELTGLIVSIVVAFAGLHFASKINLKSAILALFNGCLIFFTLVGGTSYWASVTDKTANEEFRKENPLTAAFITPLNQDKNLIKMSTSLSQETVTLKEKVQSLDSETGSLIRKNDIYKKDLNYLATYIGRMSPTAFKKNTILNRISITKNRILQVPKEIN